MKIISIVSTKGGVGKTTLTANLAGNLYQQDKKVLMIDADPQPSLSSYYKITKQANGGLTEVFVDPAKINDCISETQYGDLIYSNDPHNQIQSWLTNQGDGRFRLKIAIKKLVKKYDYILIDTQGAKGNLQDAAVLVANLLITPILPEATTIKELERGTLSMIDGLKGCEEVGIKVPNLLGVVYRLDNTTDASQFTNLLFTKNSEKYQILTTTIPQSVVFKEAITQQIPVTEFLNGNKKTVQKAQKSADAIIELSKELNL